MSAAGSAGGSSKRDRPEVSVVVISHEHAADLPACLEALDRAMEQVEAELIFVDNRSRDRSFEIAQRDAPERSTLIRNERRRGFAENANEGIRRSAGDTILLLNPDTVVEQWAIAELLSYQRSNPGVGIVAPALYFPDGSLQPSRRRFPTLRSTVARRSPARRWMRGSSYNRMHLMLDQPPDSPQRIDWALAACWLLSREALDDVGLFDEGFPLYVEDIDLAYRMQQRGWEVVFLPSARVEHHHHAVTDRRWLTPRTLAHFRGMARFVRKHGIRLR
jgi:N-acetylglucosaminyl-diphospho-decaprenol L-rhamnosyltransferase